MDKNNRIITIKLFSLHYRIKTINIKWLLINQKNLL